MTTSHHIINTTSLLESTTDRINVGLLALNRVYLMEDYYSDLTHEDDLKHNMEQHFGELRAIYELLFEEMNALKNYKNNLHKALKDAQQNHTDR